MPAPTRHRRRQLRGSAPPSSWRRKLGRWKRAGASPASPGPAANGNPSESVRNTNSCVVTGCPFRARSRARSSGERLDHQRRYFSFVSSGSSSGVRWSATRVQRIPDARDRARRRAARAFVADGRPSHQQWPTAMCDCGLTPGSRYCSERSSAASGRNTLGLSPAAARQLEEVAMRKVAVSLVVLGGSVGIAALPAAAEAPAVRSLPTAACNQGTHNAHMSIPLGTPGHPHVPHNMGFCMTMPGAHP